MSLKTYIARGLEYILKGTPEINVVANITQLKHSEILNDKVALITGGGSGIGKAIVKSMLLSGAKVIITGRNDEKLRNSITNILADLTIDPKKISPLVLDNNNVDLFKDKIDFIFKEFGRLDILVNNAGIMGGDIVSCDVDEFETIINTNLRSVFFLSKIVGERMKNGNIQGNILNISSSSSIRPANSAYALTKWGIRGLTMGLAKLLIPYGIVVNAIAPGPTATSMLNVDEKSNLYYPNPLGRYIKPEEIAEMAVFLTSNLGRSIIGDTIFMTGGSGLLTMDDIKYRF